MYFVQLVNHIIKSTFGLRSHTHDLARLSWHSIDFATTHSGVRTQMAYEDYCNTVLRKTGSQFLVVAHPPASLQPANRRFHRSWADGFELLMPFGLGELASGGVRNRQYTLAHVKRWSPSVNAHLRTNSAGFGLGLRGLSPFSRIILIFVEPYCPMRGEGFAHRRRFRHEEWFRDRMAG